MTNNPAIQPLLLEAVSLTNRGLAFLFFILLSGIHRTAQASARAPVYPAGREPAPRVCIEDGLLLIGCCLRHHPQPLHPLPFPQGLLGASSCLSVLLLALTLWDFVLAGL